MLALRVGAIAWAIAVVCALPDKPVHPTINARGKANKMPAQAIEAKNNFAVNQVGSTLT
jgi:hypothetical protein